jgi:ribosome biogenesis GTPase
VSLALSALGWTPSREEEFEQYAAAGLAPARVAAQQRGLYTVRGEADELSVEVSGRLRHESAGPADLPAVGDWVAVRAPATVDAILPRETAFVRKAAGTGVVEQVVAANVDVVLLVTAFDADLNIRRLERYLAAAWESGAQPVIVVNKSDLAADPAAELTEVEAIAFGVPVHAVSCREGGNLDGLTAYFAGNRTVALLGSSGVGKSSLVNRLLGGERQEVGGLRGDGRGRHTTTTRELFAVPGGGLVLDTPGMRQLGLWDAGGGLGEAFDDVASLAAECRFADCAHESEPGCEVLAAVADGRLDPDRLESYRKLLRELRHLELKTDARARSEERQNRRRFARSRRRSAY